MIPADILVAAQRAMLALNRADVRYALCGGLAVAVWTEPRATKDIDILIDADDLGRADAALAADGWFTSAAPIAFPDGIVLHRRLSAVAGKVVILDLLVPPPALDLLSDRVRGDLLGTAGWVVSRRALTVMKRMAGRPQDLVDLGKLDAS